MEWGILQMYEEMAVERIAEWRPIVVRRIGRPRLRWKGDDREDLEKMKMQNGNKIAMEREAWKRIVEQAKTHKE